MKKIKLFAIGNHDKFNYYIFEKNQESVEILFKAISEVFGEEFEFPLYDEHQNKKGIWMNRKINFNKVTDVYEWRGNDDDVRIDIFYGNKKFFVNINCSLELRAEFNDKLEKVSKMKRPKKFKPIEK